MLSRDLGKIHLLTSVSIAPCCFSRTNLKLAALTTGYQAYDDIWLHRQFLQHVGKLREKYGQVVRINPREIHINDPTFVDELLDAATTRSVRSLTGSDVRFCPGYGYIHLRCPCEAKINFPSAPGSLESVHFLRVVAPYEFHC
ncbi:hypothetical protein FQN51_000244 [Onygenales sp. PD_10]|nr:hypothetical protein FQN51_000244 [Onygenales sp. PD_10]